MRLLLYFSGDYRDGNRIRHILNSTKPDYVIAGGGLYGVLACREWANQNLKKYIYDDVRLTADSLISYRRPNRVIFLGDRLPILDDFIASGVWTEFEGETWNKPPQPDSWIATLAKRIRTTLLR